MANESPTGLVWKSGGAFEFPDWKRCLELSFKGLLQGEECVAALGPKERLQYEHQTDREKTHQNKTKGKDTLKHNLYPRCSAVSHIELMG